MLEPKRYQKGKYKAVIIGAGRIGARFDNLKSERVLTHAHAYYKNPRIDLLGFFDINQKNSKEAALKWGGSSFKNLEEAFKAVPDIVSVCVPDKYHFPILSEIIRYRPKLVICEKPATTNLRDTEKILRLYKKAGISILVNYSHRFDKTLQTLKVAIQKKKFGKVLCASGIYTKGLLHNGSHLIDLSRYLFGEVKNNHADYSFSDYYGEDKNISGFIAFEKCPQFYLMAGDERKYSIIELDILLEKKRIRFVDFVDSGFFAHIQEIVKDPIYTGYKCLGKSVIKRTCFSEALPSLIKNAVNYLEGRENLKCGIEDAYFTQKACFSLLNNYKQ